ncbi:MAG TPA: PIN domain-containing protein [Chthoniobacterales bacterium]
MAIILDAAVVIQGEKGLFDLTAWLAANPNEQFELAAITVAELWHGVETATPRHRAKRMNYVNAVTSAMPIIPYTDQTAYKHARIWAYLEKKGKMIDAHDLIVAATALQRQSQVATLNRKHFDQVPGLKVIVP